MKAPNPNPSICPACGEPNGCSMSEQKCERDASGGTDKCWCMAYPAVAVGSEYPKNICLCERCLKHQMQTELGSEIEP